jgi:hypothetical protein
MTEQLAPEFYLHKMQDRILRELSDEMFKKIQIRVIRNIQKHRPVLFDSYKFKNMWDEICIIVQEGDNTFYSDCENTVDNEIDLVITKMKISYAYLVAMWLQTPQGFSWAFNREDKIPEEDYFRYDIADIASHIRSEWVFSAAMNWSNKRIERFQESSYEMDNEYY